MTLTDDEIIGLIDQLESESKAIKEDILKMCWFMRGGVTLDEAMQLSVEERRIINNIIKDNLDTAKKSGLPFF